ncbi:hypothetical protein PPYR_02588 [Photinus pyralis]|uniref:Grh/CP2 DB domain-containing protein n=2 Tax=Photinus pyralis TaxID=7054 RepID=A0A5N4B7U3_PHOPY|nr:transcription factor CP2-like protein 1 isoform X1 [Photinus pyralis]KAB0805618.1 hypothetical protein PPYR_02588 [Photinus pyralis]
MEFQLCQNNPHIFSIDRINSRELWNIINEPSMNSDDCLGWTNDHKIDNFINTVLPKTTSKRKLSSSGTIPFKTKSTSNENLKEPSMVTENFAKSTNAKRNMAENGTSRMPPWQVDDISDLNADLEGSLAGLGADLSSNSYNMSEAILSLPGLPVFKQEAPSPTSNEAKTLSHPSCIPVTSSHTTTNSAVNDGNSNQNMFNNTLQHLLGGSTYSSLQTNIDGNNIASSPSSLSQDGYHVTSSSNTFGEDCRFQYVLAAATSIATKVNEDTLTYLNQGQSYEIKLKKLGDLSAYRGKLLKTVIRICFHERRLQYMEREQMSLWQQSRPGDRILEVDVPLSYGLCDVLQPSNALNLIAFTWDPTKEVGVYIKVNCISTEFTPKKHGGEKGVPFRIQVETYQASEPCDSSKRLHAGVCQIKVFKLKGADRKHKQDREKILKRPVSEQEKYQPSYECTVLNDIPLDAVVTCSSTESSAANRPYSPESETTNIHNRQANQMQIQNDEAALVKYNQQKLSPAHSNENSYSVNNNNNNVYISEHLLPGSNPQLTAHWLNTNRFDKYVPIFANFGGADMLRMSRDDLIQICGQADGIRLYNVLHAKAITPKLTIYIGRENTPVFNAIFLSSYTSVELMQKLAALTGVPGDKVSDIYMNGPQAIHVQLSNDVIRHIKEETMFSLEILQDNGNYIFVLKPYIK